MSADTALVLVGRAHPNDGGLVSSPPPVPLWLSEGSTALWRFEFTDRSARAAKLPPARPRRFEIAASPSEAIDDALLLCALVFCDVEAWPAPFIALRSALFEGDGRLDAGNLPDTLRFECHRVCRERSKELPKTVVVILEPDSVANDSLAALRHYAHDMTVCLPTFRRGWVHFAQQRHETGSLPTDDRDDA